MNRITGVAAAVAGGPKGGLLSVANLSGRAVAAHCGIASMLASTASRSPSVA
jgi:hypothetical protein